MFENGSRRNVRIVVGNNESPLKVNSRACNCDGDHDFSASASAFLNRKPEGFFILNNESNKDLPNDSKSCSVAYFSTELGLSFDNNSDQDAKLFNNDSYSLIPVWCDICDCYGHLSRDCPEASVSDGARRRLCANCCSRDHFDHKRCPQKFCSYCSDSGHTTNYCPKMSRFKSSECFRCRARGHQKANCPTIWRQYFLSVDGDLSNDVSGQGDQVNDRKFCCMCAEEGHFYTECHLNSENSPDNNHSGNRQGKISNRNNAIQGHNSCYGGAHIHYQRGRGGNNGPSKQGPKNLNKLSLDARRRKASNSSLASIHTTQNNRPGLLEPNYSRNLEAAMNSTGTNIVPSSSLIGLLPVPGLSTTEFGSSLGLPYLNYMTGPSLFDQYAASMNSFSAHNFLRPPPMTPSSQDGNLDAAVAASDCTDGSRFDETLGANGQVASASNNTVQEREGSLTNNTTLTNATQTSPSQSTSDVNSI